MRIPLKVLTSPTPLFLVLAVSTVSVILDAKRIPKHVCHFDEMERTNKLVRTETPKDPHAATNPNKLLSKTRDQNRHAKQSLQTWAAVIADEPDQQETWEPLRISFSSLDMKNQNKYCDRVKARIKDAFGKSINCKAEDILTTEKIKSLFQIVRAAIAMHSSRLSVAPLQNKIMVPALDGTFCKLFTVPEKHKTIGVANADMVLYIASLPSSKDDMFAAGAPCALQPSDSRPVVGALTYTTKHIEPTVYSVRVAMHEIAHALGFTYNMMKDTFKMNIQERHNVRYKEKVIEVQSAKVVEKFQEHYNCTDGRGMELEDEAGVLNVTSQSHWERRNALEDLMAGIVITGTYTALTLAAFEDMKVYKADFDKAETVEYGEKVGCGFFTNRCVRDGVKYWWMLCTDRSYSDRYFCAPGRRAMAKCSDFVPLEDYSLEKYHYSHGRYTGETRLLTDRCPIYEEHDDTSCTDPNSKMDGVKSPQSWCLRKSAGWDVDKWPNKGICGKMLLQDDGATLNVEVGSGYGNRDCRTEGGNTFISFADIQYSQYKCPTVDEMQSSNDLYNLYMEQSTNDEVRAATPTETLKLSATKNGAAVLKICAAQLITIAIVLLLWA